MKLHAISFSQSFENVRTSYYLNSFILIFKEMYEIFQFLLILEHSWFCFEQGYYDFREIKVQTLDYGRDLDL